MGDIGESSCSIFLKDMDMVTTTTLILPDWRHVSSLTVPVDSWLPATSQNAPRSLSTIGCSLLIPVTHTEDSSLTHTSCPAHVLVTSLKRYPSSSNPKNPKATSHD